MRLIYSWLTVVLLTLGFVYVVHAQGGGGGQTAFESVPGPLANCPTPQSGKDILCDVTGTGWEQSINGAGYTPFNQPGPQGTPGVPQSGQSFSQQCANADLKTSGTFTASGCIATVP